jgi:hypothetical protein
MEDGAKDLSIKSLNIADEITPEVGKPTLNDLVQI